MTSGLIDTTEMYLRTVFELEEEQVVPLRARLVERLHHAGPTVSETCARLEREGLLLMRPDRSLELTDDGRRIAVSVMRKHRLAELLLVDVIGMPYEAVHAEACRWEHVISDEVEARLTELLGDPETCPHGNPLPGRAVPAVGAGAGESLVPLSRASTAVAAGPVVVRRIGESVQGDAASMRLLASAGLVPGASVQVRGAADGAVTVLATGPVYGGPAGSAPDGVEGGTEVELPLDVAEHVLVTPA